MTFDPPDQSDIKYSISTNKPDVLKISQDCTFVCLKPGKANVTVALSNDVSTTFAIEVINLAAFAEETFRLTNSERLKYGVPALSPGDKNLNAAALVRAEEIIESFSHTRPDGRICFTAFEEAGAVYKSAAENLASGFQSPLEAIQGWMNSPGHKANLLNEKMKYMSVGLAIDEDGVLYFTQLFIY